MATLSLRVHGTVNSQWYITICLPTVLGVIRKAQKRSRFILILNNASSHKLGYLSTLNVEMM